MGFILRLKKYFVGILVFALCVACEHKELIDENRIITEEISEEGSFVVTGVLYALKMHNEFAVFRVQLVKGDVTNETSAEDLVYQDAPVLAIKNSQSFEFGGLTKGVYTIIVTRDGYETVREKIQIGWMPLYYKNIIMNPIPSAGADDIQVLNEEGKEISSIEVIPYATSSVSFYLYNGTESNMSYNLTYYMTSGYNMRSFIINGKIERVNTNWISGINEQSGMLPPNTLRPIEVLIDSNVYLINEHSKCKILINYSNAVELSF